MRNLQILTDEELALLYVEGDNRAFDELLSRNEVKIFSYIMFMVHDEEVANDIFQETFVKVITKFHKRLYYANGKFCAWCMRIAHNVIMDLYREERSKRIVEVNEMNDLSNLKGEVILEGNTEDSIVFNQVLLDVKSMVNQLPPLQREVVYMRYYQQIPFQEIAEMTGVSINTALGRMRYAMLNLRRMAKKHKISLDLC